MSVRALISVITVSCLLTACANQEKETYIKVGQGNYWNATRYKDDKRVNGQENDDYKIEAAGGVSTSIDTNNPSNSSYRYFFGFLVKSDKQLASVKVERISGSLKEVVVDNNPAASSPEFMQNKDGSQSRFIDNSWVGQSKLLKLNCTEAAWLCENGTTEEVYQFTITDKSGQVTVIKQNTAIVHQAKAQYRKYLGM